MDTKQFFPGPRVVQNAYAREDIRLETDKGKVNANWASTEVCLNKCNVNMADAGFSEGENNCLKKCYNKYFDSQLLIDREHEHFTVGNPYA